jgi:hypothetical protein
MRGGKPVGNWAMRNDTEFSIVAQYQTAFRGVVNYYRLADNVGWLARLKWVMETALTKTLAAKLRLSVPRVYRRFRATIATPAGPRKVLLVTVERGPGKLPLVAQWGGISLARDTHAVLDDQPPRVWNPPPRARGPRRNGRPAPARLEHADRVAGAVPRRHL